jgi:hypothetical protein
MAQQLEITIVSAASKASRAALLIRLRRHLLQAKKRISKANSYAIQLGATRFVTETPPNFESSITRAAMKIVPARLNANRAKRPSRS